MRLAGTWSWMALGAALASGCSSGDTATPTSQDETPSPTITSRPTEPTAAAVPPPRSGPARVELWHCGLRLLGYPEGLWEMRRPPFDATNAPDSFTGRGRASVPRTDRLVYVDRGGQRLVFVPGREVPPRPCA